MNWIIPNRINNKKNTKLIIINNQMNVIRMPKKHFYNMNAIYNNYNYDFVDINDIQNINLKNYSLIIIDQYSLAIDKLHSETIKITVDNLIELIPNNIKLVLMMEDMDDKIYENYTKLKELMNKLNCIGIISYYNNKNLIEINKLKNNLTLYHLPHHINTNIYKDYNQEKDIDILFFGCKNSNLYPLRLKLWILFLGSINKKYKIIIIKHPGYKNYDKNKCGKSLAKLINRAWLTVATTTKYERTVAKYFEISACKSVVVGNTTKFIDNFWGNNIVKINKDMEANELLQIFDNYLSNKKINRNV